MDAARTENANKNREALKMTCVELAEKFEGYETFSPNTSVIEDIIIAEALRAYAK